MDNTQTITTSAASISKQFKALSRSNAQPASTLGSKTKTKPNGSILNFFKKASPGSSAKDDSDNGEENLFLEEISTSNNYPSRHALTPPRDHGSEWPLPDESDSVANEETLRYNEIGSSVKRRRTRDSGQESSSYSPSKEILVEAHSRKGPFLDDSEDGEDIDSQLPQGMFDDAQCQGNKSLAEAERAVLEESLRLFNAKDSSPIPSLKHEPTSINEGADFYGMADFIDDEFPEEGEEYLERKWMEEQRRLEDDMEIEDGEEISARGRNETGENPISENATTTCPICNIGFNGLTDLQASTHVNDCLDGKPLQHSASSRFLAPISEDASFRGSSSTPAHKRFQRAAIPRPGQENPFNLVSKNAQGSSAFSKLMSSHAEDTAWAAAAASEVASRGKPAYQRTCPFYKILPGFFICVDAFRYGAVEGCNAYFLSHFHSDHYIGLTSSWSYGPIYCSHVTANLVRRQLRVDPKWVFDLEFDQKLEVPRTEGVEVTMIPANHCPGSSLFLFEKVIGQGKSPKIQRVLHCGDFRACPAHVQHPRLRPDIVDKVTGRNLAQQKLDVCYLDTTYLTPKYAFPSQEEVIKACADMCVSLSKDQVDEHDNWEQAKKDRAGGGMVQFMRKGSDLVKQEIDEDDPDCLKAVSKSKAKKSRGRLLVVVGTYSIGKERICLGVARALNSKIYAPPSKQKICAALEDPELTARLTSNALEAQVHMQMLMEIRAETLADYLIGYKPHFSRIVGFRPSGWNYRPPNSRFVESPAVQTVLHSDNWKSHYSMAELVPQRGSTQESQCFGVPYSEHSSFRELTMFCCALRINKIIPTVNVGSAKSREKMKAWCEKWAAEKKKNGLFKVAEGQTAW